MSVTNTTGSFISLETAQTMVEDWVSTQTSVNAGNPKAHGFGGDRIKDILNQRDCVGLMIYNGIENGDKRLVIVGIDATGNEMKTGLILDQSSPCPPNCVNNPIA